jgi:hypothetical protein
VYTKAGFTTVRDLVLDLTEMGEEEGKERFTVSSTIVVPYRGLKNSVYDQTGEAEWWIKRFMKGSNINWLEVNWGTNSMQEISWRLFPNVYKGDVGPLNLKLAKKF